MKTTIARLSLIYISIVIMSLIFTGKSFAKINPETCVGMWLFDEGKGDIAKDSSNNGNDGTLNNDPKWVEGKFGNALEFDGSDDYVIAPDSTILNPYPYTFSAWVKLEKYGQDANVGAIVLGNYGGDVKGSIFYISNVGLLSIRVHPPSFTVASSTAIPLKQWTHIATTFEGTSLTVYVNGKEDGNGTSAGYAGGFLRHFVIAKASWFDGNYFNGIIDDIGVFNQALTEDDIERVMAEGLEKALGLTAVSPSSKFTQTWASIKAH